MSGEEEVGGAESEEDGEFLAEKENVAPAVGARSRAGRQAASRAARAERRMLVRAAEIDAGNSGGVEGIVDTVSGGEEDVESVERMPANWDDDDDEESDDGRDDEEDQDAAADDDDEAADVIAGGEVMDTDDDEEKEEEPVRYDDSE